MQNKKIGFIGQGWIGKNYADNFEQRGYAAVRYSLEEPYINNRDAIKECDIVLIAVPTPTTPRGFDDSILRSAMKLIGAGKIALIKSTVLPGTTRSIQDENQEIYVMHSPEFLTRHTAAYDAANPNRNIIGIPRDIPEYRQKAEEALAVLPEAPYNIVCPVEDAELVKYGGNCFFYFKNIFMNMLYDVAQKHGCNWENVREMVAADPRIGQEHTKPINKGGRGAGGDCLIKDFEAFLKIYKDLMNDEIGVRILENLRDKNIRYLVESKKDLELLKGVYGEDVIN